MRRFTHFSALTQAQQIAVILGAEHEASFGDKWLPCNRVIVSSKTQFRIRPSDAHLEEEAKWFLDSRQQKSA